MNNKNQKEKTRRLRKWFKRKNKRTKAFYLDDISGEETEDEGDQKLDGILGISRSWEIDRCTLTNELRIFVGTWNVAGRSPTGSLAVDLEEWLNLKDEADIYVLGFQEVVPLKTRNVIGVEDPRKAANWNLIIGKTLNNKVGCPWMTPLSTPISSDNYNYARSSELVRENSLRYVGTPVRQKSMRQQDEAFGGSIYKLVASKKMVGVFVSVWMKKELLQKYCISNVKVCSVACGIMGYLGNKGAVSVSMSIEGVSFCFIAAHLASGEKKGDEGKRNHQVLEIFKRTSFNPSPQENYNPLPPNILAHDRIFLFGDLNYRLYLEDSLARHLIDKQDWKALQQFDQLRRELEDGGVFQGWREGNIEFAPTYKYSSLNSNRYSGDLQSKSGEKQRTPAWCDRILWYGKGVKQLSYLRSESKFSDHRPVSALFSTPVFVRATNPAAIPTHDILRTGTPPWRGEPINSTEEARSTLLSLLVQDIAGTPRNMHLI
ncbi:hypothetical protein K2173_014019 [Erythroxylum novogranatense]|uniref:Inositol polyphosphate-related phosphatase domain-containing protein n=1 Tax=Erythroxylum novogranatense TaxID=1862640 RepID=A0AAV8SDI0_9ROSI|nr:hypothetical protein K2173_014019 [Erythroxylum novogranatense]